MFHRWLQAHWGKSLGPNKRDAVALMGRGRFFQSDPEDSVAIWTLGNKINVIYRPPINKLIPNEVDV